MYTTSELPEIELKYKKTLYTEKKVSCSNEVAEALRPLYDPDTITLNENVIILFIDGANKIIGWMKHSIGGTGQTVVDLKLILATALKCVSTSIIISHNHPSGQLTTSREDENITKKLQKGCESVGLRLLDHVIITPESYYSFADNGLI